MKDHADSVRAKLRRLFPKREVEVAVRDYGHILSVAWRNVDESRSALSAGNFDLSHTFARAMLRRAYPRGWATP
jgi:hypothetical protein